MRNLITILAFLGITGNVYANAEINKSFLISDDSPIVGACLDKVYPMLAAASGEKDIFVNYISASKYAKNSYTAGYSYPDCHGTVSIQIQSIIFSYTNNGNRVVSDCSVLKVKADHNPTCGDSVDNDSL